MPKNPLINLLYSVFMVAVDVYKANTFASIAEEFAGDERYDSL